MATTKIVDEALNNYKNKPQPNRNNAAKTYSVPAAPAKQADNYDEAPPGVPGPDYSARKQIKPAFSRGMSMLDYTAVTSAGPTPANEIPNPMGSHMKGPRMRESHLPDDVDFMRRQTVTERDTGLPRKDPRAETRGTDEFAPGLSRQEAEAGAQDQTSSWEGTNDGLGSHS